MEVNTAIAIAASILSLTLVGLVLFIVDRRRQAREDEMRREASTRGWKFDSRSTMNKRIHTWTGSTDGIAWRVESIHSQSKNDRRHNRQQVSRWHGDFSPGVNGPIVIMSAPKGKEIPAFSNDKSEGLIAQLAQKTVAFVFDKAIDVYFGDDLGKEVDAGKLHRINVPGLPAFAVMAADKDEGARIMSQGLEAALVSAIGEKTSVFANENRPSILLRPHGISMARTSKLGDINELDAFVRAGVGLTRAFTFGRRSPS